ncbi:MAG: glycosyltransferase family 2 protein [Desulfonauticus sp.]|nr:glycosyltransferase family 2 protein [Desulfonauticus sp.]
MNKINATGLVLTYNGEKLLKKTLESLSFCKEVLVIDSNSQDHTVQIAKEYGAKVIINPWEGPASQFNFAFQHITTPWVINLDQDEILSPQLQHYIQKQLSSPYIKYDGFYCRRKSFYFDRFLKHCGWYPDYLLRIFKLSKIKVTTSGPHWHFSLNGTTQKIPYEIIHYPYENLSQHLDKINYYTQIAAKELIQNNKTSSLSKALGHGLARFIKIYFLKLGFLDGRAGFILALHAFFYGFHKYIRVLELKLNENKI